MKRLICLFLICSLAISSAARADSAVAWGNYPGDGTTYVGDGMNMGTLVPVSDMDSGVTAVAAGGCCHSLAVKDGGVYSWGTNDSGQLGDGTTTTRPTPVPVSGLSSGVTAVAAGGFSSNGHSLAVQNGAVFAWGRNAVGALGDGTRTQRLAPVGVIGMDSGVTAVAAGAQHSLAVKNGGLWAWGANGAGQLGNGTIPTIPPNGFTYPTPAPVIGLASGVTAIAAGPLFSLAVKDGGVYSWGSNQYGQLGDGTYVSRGTPELVAGLETGATAVAAGDFSLAVVHGSAYYWNNYTGGIPVQVDPTNLTNIVEVAAADCCDAYALSSDGRLWFWNAQSSLPTPHQLLPPAGYKFSSIAASANHAVATLAVVPEPSAFALAAMGVFGMVAGTRRRCRWTCVQEWQVQGVEEGITGLSTAIPSF